MAQALYHPALGYYSSGRAAIGREGDYFTNVSVGPLFGHLMAAQFAEIWERLDWPGDFTIVEQGAHDGQFARDVLEAARSRHAELFAALSYAIVEPSPIWRERQTAKLADFADKVSWMRSLEELPPFRGVHFSNELLDAFPVHLLCWNGSEWRERHITEKDDAFSFVDLPLSDPRLALTPSGNLPVGYGTEVRLSANEWLATLSGKLKTGFVLAVDYGWPRAEFLSPHRTVGTLRAYALHRVLPSPLERIGHADLTAHVEWTSLVEFAQDFGFTLAGFTDQHHFLTGLLASDRGKALALSANDKTKRALQTLLHPQQLGMKFQFLALAKNVAAMPPLSGYRLARNPETALGLRA
ncbi:MAG: class I SAM-dependent methyltransferase [Chthoniobacterales bacterium]